MGALTIDRKFQATADIDIDAGGDGCGLSISEIVTTWP